MSTFRKVLPYLRPYRWLFLLSIFQMLAITATELLKPWPLKVVVDNVLGRTPIGLAILEDWSPTSLLLAAVATTVAVQALIGLISMWSNYVSIGIGQSMVNDIRGDLYGHLQRLSLLFHSRQRLGDLMYRITADTYAVQTLMLNGVLPVLQAATLLAGMFLVMWGMDPSLTLLAIVVCPILYLVIHLLDRPIVEAAEAMKRHEAAVYSVVQWAMGAIKVVQAFGKEEEERKRFLAASRASMDANLRLYNWQTAYSAIVNTIIAFGTALVLYAGAEAVLGGRLSLGQLLVFVTYLASLYGPINTMSQTWGQIQGARIGARRVFELLDVEPDLKDGVRLLAANALAGRVTWRGVAFHYHADVSVLRAIDLDVAPGERIAVVGPTGAGKSTMLGMLPRFFDPTSGAIEIDGIDIREFQLKDLRRQVAMVLQPPLIFPLSIRDNIAYGRPEASQAEIEAAARLARIDQMIGRLPQGYDTQVGEGGATLSEGEKQRLTIARAILMDARFLILDEPTSSLDAETEAQVMAGLAALTSRRTTFTIAHRLSTVVNADRIVVLRDGIIVESGPFAELIRRNGAFAQLYRTQFQERDKQAAPPA
ncbi:MAG: ABC transporter ATP-binding protein [Proteobacteria bacterium]|nr:ABC transporter ATP-binding protein [Pseudomonadota bacterium]MBI3497725.1 ABC transporter ATP-binding protein [Pseudomonadota bacterium]